MEAQRRVEAQIRHSSPAQAPLTIPNAEIVPMSRTPIFDLSKEQFLKDTIANATRQHRTLYPHRVPRNWNETVLFSIAWIRTDVGATRLPSCIKCHQTLTNISLSITSSERIDVNGTEWTVVNKKARLFSISSYIATKYSYNSHLFIYYFCRRCTYDWLQKVTNLLKLCLSCPVK